ncbi:MAG: DUF6364 family protein [Ignavibacteriaceae bacterium]
MNTKLTLKLNKKSIERAKKYARKNKKSLSLMVENYFNMVSEKNEITDIEISPNVLELSGVINLKKQINIKEEYQKHIENKYSK